MKTPLQILIDARALIDSPEKWTQGRYRIADSIGTSYCVIGSLLYSCGCSELGDAEELLKRGAGIGYLDSITDWNDNCNRAHADVLRAFDTAIALARQAEAQP